jgi:hypothetical protein
MREVGCEDGSLAALGLGVSKLSTWKSSSVGHLESNAMFRGFAEVH